MIKRSETTHKLIGGLLTSAIFATALLLPALTAADEVFLTDGAPSEGTVMLIGDKKQWDTFVSGGPIASASGYLSVAPNDEERAMRAKWNGKGEAQIFLAHQEARDYTNHLEANSALVVLLQVVKPPKKKVTIRMGCGYPCAANADISKVLKALPKEQWVRLSFDLKCFADGGLNIKNVDTPFLITTRGKMTLSIADVRLVPDLGGQATIRCS